MNYSIRLSDTQFSFISNSLSFTLAQYLRRIADIISSEYYPSSTLLNDENSLEIAAKEVSDIRRLIDYRVQNPSDRSFFLLSNDSRIVILKSLYSYLYFINPSIDYPDLSSDITQCIVEFENLKNL